MTIPAQGSATYEDLCRVPDHLIAQIIHGQLVTLPPTPLTTPGSSTRTLAPWKCSPCTKAIGC